ncbi:MAG: hypothetical protein ABIG84_08150 [archaeon]
MIVGINLDFIMAKKYNQPKGNIRIDNKTKITDVKQIDVPYFKEKATKIEFMFQTTYNAEKEPIGEIQIGGNVIYRGQKEKLHETWLNEKKLPEDIALHIMNNILRKSITRVIDLSEQLMLPPPINLPLIHPKKEKKEQNIEYIG